MTPEQRQDIDIKIRELVLGGSAYQARELAHSLQLSEWAELLDLLLDRWIAEERNLGTYVRIILTPQQCEAVVQHNDRLGLIVGLEVPYTGWFRVPYKAHKCGRVVLRLNPDIRARVIAMEATP